MLDNVSICTDYHIEFEKTIRYLPAHKNTLFEQNYGKHLDTAEKKNQISTQNTGKGLNCWNDQLMETRDECQEMMPTARRLSLITFNSKYMR